MSFQPPTVVHPDVELWATGYLRAALAARGEAFAQGVFVSNQRPTSNRRRTVVIRRDGGPQRGLFDFPRLGARVLADLEQEAADLSRLVQALLLASPGNGPVLRAASLSGPSGVPDESQFQKYLTLELTTRGLSL